MAQPFSNRLAFDDPSSKPTACLSIQSQYTDSAELQRALVIRGYPPLTGVESVVSERHPDSTNMAEQMREHLVRLRELTAQLNEHSDEVNRVAMAVERFLSADCKVGVEGQVVIDYRYDEDMLVWQRTLKYSRLQGEFRLHLVDWDLVSGDPEGPDQTPTLWANCSRDDRLAAYEKLPALLEILVENLAARVEKIRVNSQAINEILESTSAVKSQVRLRGGLSADNKLAPSSAEVNRLRDRMRTGVSTETKAIMESASTVTIQDQMHAGLSAEVKEIQETASSVNRGGKK
jgi:hypothetical protein